MMLTNCVQIDLSIYIDDIYSWVKTALPAAAAAAAHLNRIPTVVASGGKSTEK